MSKLVLISCNERELELILHSLEFTAEGEQWWEYGVLFEKLQNQEGVMIIEDNGLHDGEY